MYSKKAVYFNYKSFAAVLFLLLFPATLIFAGGSLGVATLSLYPILGGIVLAVIVAFPGLPRLLAINANADLKQDKISKALQRVKIACRLPFAPVSVHIFAAYIYLLNGLFYEAGSKLEEIKDKDMSFPEKSKYIAIKSLHVWLTTESPEAGIEALGELNRKGANESIYYAAGRMMNICREPAEARKFNEQAMELNPGNRDIMENLVISYCRTGQDGDAKLLFRNLYYDLKATSDSFYFMAELKIKDGKNDDALDFLSAALAIEDIATNIVKREKIEARLNELRGAAL
jgi:predicted Zn-dependent protease